MCVCVCVCVCACVVHVFTRVYISVQHICVHVTMCMHVCVCLPVTVCVHVCVVCVCAYMHAFWYACLHVGMCKIFLPTSIISVSFYVVNCTVSR